MQRSVIGFVLAATFSFSGACGGGEPQPVSPGPEETAGETMAEVDAGVVDAGTTGEFPDAGTVAFEDGGFASSRHSETPNGDY